MNVSTCTFYGHFISPPFFADELFRDLARPSEDALRLIRRPKEFSKNDTVFAAGDLPNCIYILNSGQARLTVTNGINKVTSRRLVKPDEVLGLNELLANSFCQMNVETITPCVFECLRRQDFLSFLDAEPAICYRLLSVIASNSQQSYTNFSAATF